MTDKYENGNEHQNNGYNLQKSPEFQSQGILLSPVVVRERSFVRSSNQNATKRRSLAFNVQQEGNQIPMRNKPALDIYRPPNVRNDTLNYLNKLNVNAQEFTMLTNSHISSPKESTNNRSSLVIPASTPSNLLPQTNIQQHLQYMSSTNRRQPGLSLGGGLALTRNRSMVHQPIFVTHPLHLNAQIPLLNSSSSGNVLHQTTSGNRVKFAVQPQIIHNNNKNQHIVQNKKYRNYNTPQPPFNHDFVGMNSQYKKLVNYDLGNGNNGNPLMRSKSLSSADTLTRGIAGLGLALSNENVDIGKFTPEIESLIDNAVHDPNKLPSRSLMELSSHLIKRAVEGRRYALPISRMCLNIIAKEQKETFLEALLNTCRQWYQEREKLLYTIQGMKSPSRLRFTAFMAFLTEMFCQLKRRQLQLRTQCEGAPPPLVLLTLLSKCCEDCVKPPVRSLSEIECLFYVLTCIGQDLEVQLPQQLEILLSLIRDAFLNSNDLAPTIRRTLLQLIELQASHWQLPGNTVLYYYPSTK